MQRSTGRYVVPSRTSTLRRSEKACILPHPLRVTLFLFEPSSAVASWSDPRAAVEQELGVRLPEEVQVVAVAETTDTIYLVLPSVSPVGEGVRRILSTSPPLLAVRFRAALA
jgi:hypothetical protein